MKTNNAFQKGFTLIEILISTAIIAVVSMISTSAYNGYIESARVSQAENQIKALSFLIDDYAQEHGVYPTSLADIGNSNLKDPWGNDYIFLNLRADNHPSNDSEDSSSGSGSGPGGESGSGEYESSDSHNEMDGLGSHDGLGSYDSHHSDSSDNDESYDSYNSGEENTRLNIASARKDGNLVPINTNYDLYSSGKDGKTKAPLRAKDSQDDIIYANDGDYVGIASEF